MNSYVGIILLYIALGIPFAVFAYYGYMHAIPRARRSSGHRRLQSVATVLPYHLSIAETGYDHRAGAQLHGRVERFHFSAVFAQPPKHLAHGPVGI